MALSAQCIILQGVSKRLLGFQSSLLPIVNNTFSQSTKKQATFHRLISTKTDNSLNSVSKQDTHTAAKKNDIVIYKLPVIKYLATMNRLKYSQTILFSAAIPLTTALSYADQLPSGCGWVVGVVGVFICSALYTVGYFCTNSIGFIYVSPDGTSVRIAYIDNWGRRHDDIMPADDVVPLSDLPRGFFSPVYLKLRRYSKEKQGGMYKMHVHHYAQVADWDRFNNLFGKIDN